MTTKLQATGQHGKTFVTILICLIIIVGAAFFIYNNQDFQRANKQQITKVKYYLRDYIKAYKDFTKDFNSKIPQWKNFFTFKKWTTEAEKPLESQTFEELLFSPEALAQELPPEMFSRQPDEITICSFNADFIFNDRLTDPEIIHLANILRFCELSTIANLQNEDLLKKLVTVLKTLRYPADYEINPDGNSSEKRYFVHLYRTDKIQILEKSKVHSTIEALEVAPHYGLFKAEYFDFVITTFAAPPSGIVLPSIEPLTNYYNSLDSKYSEIKDVLIFGNFAFMSKNLSWDSSALLPTIAQALPRENKTQDLLGNIWLRKKDLAEFNGKSGVININDASFPSKQTAVTEKPVWVQFKLMADDD